MGWEGGGRGCGCRSPPRCAASPSSGWEPEVHGRSRQHWAKKGRLGHCQEPGLHPGCSAKLRRVNKSQTQSKTSSKKHQKQNLKTQLLLKGRILSRSSVSAMRFGPTCLSCFLGCCHPWPWHPLPQHLARQAPASADPKLLSSVPSDEPSPC